MAMSKKARNEYAKIMTAFAKQYLADGIEDWKNDEDSESMIRMTRADARDYRMIGRLLREKGAKEALAHARSLDTAARECVPDQVWDAMVRDEDEAALTRQEWDDEITRRHIAALEAEIESRQRQITEAKARLGKPSGGTLNERLMEGHYTNYC